MATLESIVFNKEKGTLSILDQLLLPEASVYEEINTVQDAWSAIKLMKTRGAPAIAILGALSVAVELKRKLNQETFRSVDEIVTFIKESFKLLQTARPTAVNITEAAIRFSQLADKFSITIKDTNEFGTILYDHLSRMLDEDVRTNRLIGRHGAQHILANHCTGDCRQAVVLTHCNTGSLATGGYGTALGVIRSLHEQERLEHAYCTETRPYNQGSRLTAYELLYESIPSTLICDSMCGILMKQHKVTAVVVGADRVAANGDTANKIGTYQLAVVARHHGVPFYIAAPFTTIDYKTESGTEIVIEERRQEEMTHFAGKRIAPEGVVCWNPAFDVTPCELITGGVITERGVFEPSELLGQKDKL